MVVFIAVYLILGLIWTSWLENYTNKYLGFPVMNNTEKSFNVLFWPVQLLAFLYHFFRNL